MTGIEWWVYFVVLGGLMVVTWLLHVLVISVTGKTSPGRPSHGAGTLVIGDDGRTSTSKLQALLWTYAVLWALISLLAGLGVDAFSKALGGDLREEYLLLLGGPYAAAIAAKGITTSRGGKPPKAPDADQRSGSSMTERLVEVVSNDEGGVDLGDFQYFAFTLLTITYFAWAFIAAPTSGLPAIPGTLLVLVGVSQVTYIGKKGLPDSAPREAPAPVKPPAEAQGS